MSSESALEDLITAVAAGDRVAFRQLYDRTAGKLYGVIRRILPDKGPAEDAMQEVYSRVWRNAGSFDAARGKPITWLATIARNIAIDAHRSEVSRGGDRRAEVEIDLRIASIEGVSNEELLSLSTCLDQLEADQRACIVAAYCGGYSREELADRFAKPVGTVKSWLHRGLSSLKACLDG